ncbi:MAG: hypothetical protein PVSMB5_27880 [Ktedonobacteraceae bacterium]
MKIFVCIKQVPDPNTANNKLDANTKRLLRNGVSLVLDPGDESTISAAIKLRDTVGNSELVAVSMGPASAQEATRRALAMGVDRAILVTDPALAGSDAVGTARVLAAVIKKEGERRPYLLLHREYRRLYRDGTWGNRGIPWHSSTYICARD